MRVRTISGIRIVESTDPREVEGTVLALLSQTSKQHGETYALHGPLQVGTRSYWDSSTREVMQEPMYVQALHSTQYIIEE